MEVLLNLNPIDGNNSGFIENFQKQTPNLKIHLYGNEEAIDAPSARNQLMEKFPNFTWYLFIDDDAYYETKYFQEFSNIIKKYPEFSIIGGPNLLPPGSGDVETLSDWFLKSWFCGPFRRRYQGQGEFQDVNEAELILCNLAIKKSTELKFSKELPFGEENELVWRLQQAQGRAFYSSKLIVYHFRRQDLLVFLNQIFKYGLGRGYFLKIHPGFFILGSFIGLIFWLFINILLSAASIPILIYLKKNPGRTFFGAKLFLPAWASAAYFFGVLWGIFKKI